MLDGKAFPNFGHTCYVIPMCDGATFLGMKPTWKKLHPIYKLPRWTYEGTHVGGLHGHDGEQFFPQKLCAFDYGTNDLCKGGAWG